MFCDRRLPSITKREETRFAQTATLFTFPVVNGYPTKHIYSMSRH